MTLETLWQAARERISDLPPLEDCGQYAAHLGKPCSATTWAEFCAEVDREALHLASQANPALPIFQDESRTGWKAFHVPPASRERIMGHAQEMAALMASDAPGAFPVFEALVRRAAWWARLPQEVNEKAEDFVFARLRCVIAGAGFPAWKALAALVCEHHPACPFDPDETEEKWMEATLEAHRACGWPSSLVWWDWSSIPDCDPDELTHDMEEWLHIVALVHILKHTRRLSSSSMSIIYYGLAEVVKCGQAGRSLRLAGTVMQAASCVLRFGAPKDSAKGGAAHWAMTRLALDDLLPAFPLNELPGVVIAGPWSTLLPARAPLAFLRPGRELVNVWIAKAGRVTPFVGDEADVLDWAWNLTDSTAPEQEMALQRYREGLPATYPTIRPSALLHSAFPHWKLPDDPLRRKAYCAMIDSALCAALLRTQVPALRREFPLIAVLPADPTAEDSTNQGKGLLVSALAGAMVPGIEVISAPDSNSAPDSRAIADEMRRNGTVALDEFRVPSNQSHCLARDNLQTLCTGGVVASGRVLENSGTLRLKQPIVLNAKWLDLADDLVNRTLPLFLGVLPDSQRGRLDVKAMLESGQFATLLRLAAVSTIEADHLDELVPQAGAASAQAWRFTHHRAIAAKLYGDDESALLAIDAVRVTLSEDLRRHQIAADESGLSASSASGKNLRLSWPALWATLNDTSIGNLVAGLEMEGTSRRGVRTASLTLLMRLRVQQAGLGEDAPFCALLPALTGSGMRASNTAVCRALALNMKSYFADYLDEGARTGLYPWVPLCSEHPAWQVQVFPRGEAEDSSSPSSRTLCVAIRRKP